MDTETIRSWRSVRDESCFLSLGPGKEEGGGNCHINLTGTIVGNFRKEPVKATKNRFFGCGSC